MEYFLEIVTLFILGTVAAERTTPREGRNNAIRCFDEIVETGDITNLLLDVTTPERIDAFCRRHSDLQRCISLNEHHLSLTESTENLQKIAGVHKFYLNVCPPGTDITSEYKGNSPCFKLIRNQILSCGSDLPDLGSYKMKNDRLARCCALRTHRVCLKQAAAETCGYEAAQVIEKILVRYFETQLNNCSSISYYNCPKNGPTTALDYSTSFRKADRHTVQWDLQTEKDHRHRYDQTEREYWKPTTISDEWKKHKKNYATTMNYNSVTSIVFCLGTIFLSVFNKF